MSKKMPSPPPATQSSRKLGPSLRHGTALAFFFSGLVALPILPARRVLAFHTGHDWLGSLQFLLAGLTVDLVRLLPWASLLLLLFWGLRRWAGRWASAPALLLLGAFTLLTWGAWIASVEFYIQRGLYPTQYDVWVALTDASSLWSSAPALWDPKYLPTSLFAGLLLPFFAIRLRRRLRSPASLETRHAMTGFALGSAIVTFAFYVFYQASPFFFPAILHREDLVSPVGYLYHRIGSRSVNILHGMRSLLAEVKFPETDIPRGANLLGFPSQKATGRCEAHPLAQPFPNATAATPVMAELVKLSENLFSTRSRPVRVWHFLLESQRADDIHAQNKAAPAELTPVLNGLLTSESVITAPVLYQSGSRTSQGLGAALCGFGGLPYTASPVRDFGHTPLRCLPDLFQDAGFRAQIYYGAPIGFDNMLEYFRYHDVGIMEMRLFPMGLPKGAWGISDRAVFQYALSDVAKWPKELPGYVFVLSVSNHPPYHRPDDVPPQVDERISALVKGRPALKEHVRRLTTAAYTDYALGEFLEGLSSKGQLDDSIVVGSADHSTADPLLWDSTFVKSPGDEHHALLSAHSRIPFFISIPPALLAAARSPAEARASLGRIRAALAERPYSQNDIPNLLFALLSAHPAFRNMPETWKWHTLGGQATHPAFALADSVWGIDALSNLFKAGPSEAYENLGPVWPIDVPEDIAKANPFLQPVGAFLADFLKRYADPCWESHWVYAGAAGATR